MIIASMEGMEIGVESSRQNRQKKFGLLGVMIGFGMESLFEEI